MKNDSIIITRLYSYSEAKKLYNYFVNFSEYELLFTKRDLSAVGYPTRIRFKLNNNKLWYDFNIQDDVVWVEPVSIIRNLVLTEILK